MSRPNGGPVFPTEQGGHGSRPTSGGMTLRDYFAAKAMEQTMPVHCHSGGSESWEEQVAALAYKMADAMLAERDK